MNSERPVGDSHCLDGQSTHSRRMADDEFETDFRVSAEKRFFQDAVRAVGSYDYYDGGIFLFQQGHYFLERFRDIQQYKQEYAQQNE